MTKNLFGTSNTPRISIFRSNRFIAGQAIDDEKSLTIASLSSKKVDGKTPCERAKKTGLQLGKTLSAKKVISIVFDRNGLRYLGQVAAFADGLRESGLKF